MADQHPSLTSAVPNEVTEILKREFSTGVPQLATLGAVVAGTFGVSKIFNAGVWTVIAIITFVIIFLFQLQIPSSVPRTAVYVLFILGCTAALLFGGYARWGSKMDFIDWCEAHGNLATGIVSAGLTASIALLMVSYKKQQRWVVPYPNIIENTVTKQLKSSPF